MYAVELAFLQSVSVGFTCILDALTSHLYQSGSRLLGVQCQASMYLEIVLVID